MEMTLRRAAGLCVGAFVLMVVARPPRPTGQLYESYRDRSRLSATKQVMRVTDDSIYALSKAIRARTVRDSVAQMLSQVPAAARNQLFTDRRIPKSIQQHVRQVYAATRASMPASNMALPMLVVLDSTDGYSSWASTQWIEPSSLGTAACATIVRIGVNGKQFQQLAQRVNRVLRPNFPRPSDFGLCGYEAAFGEPSPAMHQWMAARGWSAVRIGYDPSVLTAMGSPVDDGTVYGYGRISWYMFQSDDNGVRALGLHACRAGQAEYCVTSAAPPDKSRLDLSVVLPGSDLWRPSYQWWDWRGPPKLMNAVAAALGPQRFAQAWRADDSLPDSYRRLTGVPMDTLAQRLVAETYPRIKAGASVTFGELVSVLLIAAALAGLSTLTHPRRRKP